MNGRRRRDQSDLPEEPPDELFVPEPFLSEEEESEEEDEDDESDEDDELDGFDFLP